MRFLRRDTITPPPAPVEPRLPSTEETDDRGQLAAAAARLFDRLPEGQRVAFNQLPVDRQLATLRGFSGLQLAVDSATFDPATRERIESALSTFAR